MSKSCNGQDIVHGKTKFLMRKLNCEQTKWIVKIIVWNVVLYAAETWTLTKASKKLWEAFEIWMHQRMLTISWTERCQTKTCWYCMCHGSWVYWKRFFTESIDGCGMFSHKNCLHYITGRENDRQGYSDRKKMELLHDIIEGRDYGQAYQDGDRIAHEKACQKSAGNSRRL